MRLHTHRIGLALVLLASATLASSGRAQAGGTRRVLVLPSVDGEALGRLQGQTADLAWELVPSEGPSSEVAALCKEQGTDAALWLQEGAAGALTLWIYDARADVRSSRRFALQAPAGAQARSAQLEAMALATRTGLRAADQRAADAARRSTPASPAPAKAPAPSRRGKRTDRPRTFTPASTDPASTETPRDVTLVDSQPRATEPQHPEEREAAPPPPPSPDGEPARLSSERQRRVVGAALAVEAGYGALRVSPVPWQHGPFVLAGVALAGIPLRVSCGFEQAFTVSLQTGDSQLRLGRRSVWGQLATPLQVLAAVRVTPALEVGWLQYQRRTTGSRTGEATPAQDHSLLVLRGLLSLDFRVLRRRGFVLWVTPAAGIELTPTQLVLRSESQAGPADVDLRRASPALRLGLRVAFDPRGDGS